MENLLAAKTGVAAAGVACDDGPYDADMATAGWHHDGEFSSEDETFTGIDDIRRFFEGLVADFTLHIFTNLEEVGGTADTPVVHGYGLEAPVLGGVAHFGAFTHTITHDHTTATPLTARWRQRIHLITPALYGWVRGAKVVDQTA
ncbi:hypothetical protein [Mycobacterium sp. GA-2829]|uniref:hypothetical protein n=1 Tax=Mycobacterium sp. GA-2829 TaxID=1772283 RepID=UPI00073FF8A4|nr:hypothetical protein [Mycobacterium sp. GA-2829]KUI38557.1 hypothetical protein AU194_08695 [Mycobacterium sp. GA-2829]